MTVRDEYRRLAVGCSARRRNSGTRRISGDVMAARHFTKTEARAAAQGATRHFATRAAGKMLDSVPANQVAHFGGERHSGIATYETFVRRMNVLNETVRPLYHAVLLNRIGFAPDRIRCFFHRSPHSTKCKLKMKEAGLQFVVPAAPAAVPAAFFRQPTSSLSILR